MVLYLQYEEISDPIVGLKGLTLGQCMRFLNLSQMQPGQADVVQASLHICTDLPKLSLHKVWMYSHETKFFTTL